MKYFFERALGGVAVLLIACTGYAEMIDLVAVDTASPRHSTAADHNADNRLRAYDRSAGLDQTIDGFIKFDFSAIPDIAVIEGLTLTLYGEGAFSTPLGSPEVQVRRSSFDSWVRGNSGFPLFHDEVLTAADAGPFPSARHEPVSFVLDHAAVDWSTDLLDDTLSLVLTEVSATGNDYMYFFGSSAVSATGDANSNGAVLDYVPTLSVAYTVPEPGVLGVMGLGALGAVTRRGGGES